MGKNHPNREFVGSSPCKKTSSAVSELDVVGLWSLCCKEKFEAPREVQSSNLLSVSMRVICVVLHFSFGNDNPCFFRVCNMLTETSFQPGY